MKTLRQIIFVLLLFINYSCKKEVTWVGVNNGLPVNTPVNSLAISGSSLYAGINNKGIYCNSGNNVWVADNSGLAENIINTIAINGSTIFAGTDSDGVYMSLGNGWTAINTGFPVNKLTGK